MARWSAESAAEHERRFLMTGFARTPKFDLGSSVRSVDESFEHVRAWPAIGICRVEGEPREHNG